MSFLLMNRLRRGLCNRQRRSTVCLSSLACLVTFVSGGASAAAQETSEQKAPHEISSMSAKQCDAGCVCCHTCGRPTTTDPCLPSCERTPDLYMRDQKAPDVIILDELADIYLPVPFDHEGHARMAEMTKGCVTCHHFTPEGRVQPACKTCHSASLTDSSIRKPGLKGAYHRQCLNCHRDWIDPTDCGKCHARKAAAQDDPSQEPSAETGDVVDDILVRMHPPISEPKAEIFRAESKEGAKSVVIFRHWEHVNTFDLSCVECHHEENCSRCHVDQRASDEEPPPTIREHHEPCLRCHKADMDMDEATTTISGKCKRCHWQEGDPKIKPFDHVNTGWPLGKYHEPRSCRDCHKALPFVKQSTECNACHGGWEPDSFDHAVTGQVLDDNHREIDCADCHAERAFDRPPTCDECHEEEEVAFPAQRPGPSGPTATRP